jgi:GT2 family glycosyltransferase
MASRNIIGIVTVTYNAGRIVDGFLTSLFRQTYSDFIVYVTDNASSDDTLDQVAAYGDHRVRIFRNHANLGCAEADNRGLQAALQDDCGLILLMNNDTEFEPSLFEKLVKGLDEFECDMIVPKILFYDNQQMIWSAGGGFRPRRGYAGCHYGFREIDRGQFDRVKTVEHGPACCLLLRREVFDCVGLMDNRFFLCLDDADLCYRAKQAGFKLVYLPSATLLHKASGSTGGPDSDLNARYGTRSQVIFMLKHLGIWRSLYYLPAYQVHLLLKLVMRKINLSRFWLRQNAFFEGIKVWRQTSAVRPMGGPERLPMEDPG